MSEADHRLSYLLAVTEQVMRARLDRELTGHGLSITRYSVLRLLREEPGMSGTEIARRTLVSQQACSGLLARLHRDGLVRPHVRQRAGRTIAYENTPHGDHVLAHADAEVARWERRLVDDLGPADAERLARLLRRAQAVFAHSDHEPPPAAPPGT